MFPTCSSEIKDLYWVNQISLDTEKKGFYLLNWIRKTKDCVFGSGYTASSTSCLAVKPLSKLSF